MATATVISMSSHREVPYHYASSTSSRSSHHTSSRAPSSPKSIRSGPTLPTPPSPFSNYAPTTVSSYQRRIKGMPGPDYFSSGRSKTDRRTSYVTHTLSPSSEPVVRESARSTVRSSHSAAGKELVKYHDARHSDNEATDDWRTVVPEDSISQVSFPSSHASSQRSGRRRDSGAGGRSGGSTFSDISTFESRKVWDGTRWLVERRPRRSASSGSTE